MDKLIRILMLLKKVDQTAQPHFRQNPKDDI